MASTLSRSHPASHGLSIPESQQLLREPEILLTDKAQEIFETTLDKHQQYSPKLKNLAELTRVLERTWSDMLQVPIDPATAS